MRVAALVACVALFAIVSSCRPPMRELSQSDAPSYDVRGMTQEQVSVVAGLALEGYALVLKTPELPENQATRYPQARVLWGRPAQLTTDLSTHPADYLVIRLYPRGGDCLKTLDIFKSLQSRTGRVRISYPDVPPTISYDALLCLSVGGLPQ